MEPLVNKWTKAKKNEGQGEKYVISKIDMETKTRKKMAARSTSKNRCFESEHVHWKMTM